MMIAIIFASFVAASEISETPHGVKGYVVDGTGTQLTGVTVRLWDVDNGAKLSTTSNGPAGHTGFYSFSVSGADGDVVVLNASSGGNYGVTVVNLDGDLDDINITVNVDEDAPYLRPDKLGGGRGVFVTPEAPGDNTDIICEYQEGIDPNGNSFTSSVTWYKNGVQQGLDSFATPLVSGETTFLHRLDGDTAQSGRSANYSTDSVTELNNDAGTFVSSQFNQGMNFTSPTQVLNFSNDGSVLVDTAGTVQMWVKPYWDSSAVSEGKERYFFSANSVGGGGEPWLGEAYEVLALKAEKGASSDTIVANFMQTEKSINIDWDASEWHFIAVTWTASGSTPGSTGTFMLYVDGNTESGSIGSAGPYWYGFGDDFYVSNAWNDDFRGALFQRQLNNGSEAVIDDLKISNTALSAADLDANRDFGSIGADSTSPVEVYQCKIQLTDNNSLSSYELYSEEYNVSYKRVDYSIFDGTMNSSNSSLYASKPSAIDVSAEDFSGSYFDLTNFRVEVREENGFNAFLPYQTNTSAVTSVALGSASSNSNGIAKLTFVPTGVPTATADVITAFRDIYGVYLYVYDVDDKLVYKKELPLVSDRMDEVDPDTYIGSESTDHFNTTLFPNYYDYYVPQVWQPGQFYFSKVYNWIFE